MTIICFHLPEEKNGYLSNWYPSPFVDKNDTSFASMEQYMMYQKALLFQDTQTAAQILRAAHPGKIKALGRKVANFQESIWQKKRQEIVRQGIYLKFTQNAELKHQLLAHPPNCLFAECSVSDRIGLSMHDPRRMEPTQWQGKNLLGKIIGSVRDAFLR